LVEGFLAFGLSLIPGLLTWRNANSAPILLVAPVFYGLLALAASIPAWFAIRRWPQVRWERYWLPALAGVGGYCLAGMDNRVFSTTTALIIGVAAAAVTFRGLDVGHERFRRVVARSLVPVAIVPVILGLAVIGGTALRDAWLLRRLPKAATGSPNVILLVMDTERADHLSAYGYSRPTTARLDQLAGQAVLFEAAYSPAPWTLPSHASMMTGRTPREHGAGTLTLWGLDRRYPTLAEALRGAGYVTGGFVANLFWTGRSTGLNRGFLHYEDYFRNPADAVNRTGFGRLVLFPAIEALSSSNDIPGRRHATDVNREMLHWIDGAGDRPFFAFANYNDVHQPYRPTDDVRGRFGSTRGMEAEHHGLEIGAWDEDQSVPSAPAVQNRIDRYDESLFGMDRAIGSLLDSLRARGLLEKTLIIVVADHGEQFGEHGFMGHGQGLHREELQVPLIIRDTGADRPGVRVTQPVSTTDIAATIADRVGLPPGSFPGRSLLGPDRGRPGPVLSELMTRSRPRGFRTVQTGEVQSMIEEEWHLISHDSGRLELYDRSRDPAEAHDLSDSLPYQSVLAQLRQSIGQRGVPALAGSRSRGLNPRQATIEHPEEKQE
jgi:arylsulfatase A-like enzyme